LPGTTQAISPQQVPIARLAESDEVKGRYEGSLRAPETEGYYRLQTVVNILGEAPVLVEELIAVEANPDQKASPVAQEEV
jgi:hypothetical protein